MKQITESAYAKINLCLDITARRPDGYHILDGVMQSVSLCDEVTVGFVPAPGTAIALSASGNPDMPTDRRNLAVRAAERFLSAAGLTGRVDLVLRKRIPMAGGLAGGSSDAAAVLRALNRLTGYPLTPEALCGLGAELGADVPFCIVGGARRTRGIGERLTDCPPLPPCTVVIACRGEGVSTPWAFGKLDELYGGFAPGVARPHSGLPALLAALEEGALPAVCAAVYNIFEPVVSALQPDVNVLRGCMLSHGALTARMSGSGPSVFGIFERETDAQKACAALLDAKAQAFVCHPVQGR